MNLGRSQRLMEAGRLEEALASLGNPAASPAADPRATIVLARIHEAAGRLSEALGVLERLRTERPAYAPAHLYFGIYSGDEGQAQQAVQAFDRVLELQPENDVAHSYRGLALLQLGRDAEAVSIFRSRGFNDNRMFRVRLTEWMELQWLERDRFFSQRSALSEEAARVSVTSRFRRYRCEQRAICLLRDKRYREALAELAPLTESDAAGADLLFTGALAAEMVHDYSRAIGLLTRIPEKDEFWPDALLAARGRILVRLRRYREAAEDLNRVEIVGPEDYGANYYFGVLSLAHGVRAQARRLFLRAHTQYLIDTLDSQWWQIEQALLAADLVEQSPELGD